MSLSIRIDNITHPQVIDLLRIHAETMLAQSPAGSCHFLPPEGLKKPDVTFWSMWDGEALMGCGALKTLSSHDGEIKSMHVRAAERGNGLGRRMLEHILNEARARHLKTLWLETGSMAGFLPARKLYAAHGFTDCGPFEGYTEDPNSVFMRLDLV
jgi:putative acetyltransferase